MLTIKTFKKYFIPIYIALSLSVHGQIEVINLSNTNAKPDYEQQIEYYKNKLKKETHQQLIAEKLVHALIKGAQEQNAIGDFNAAGLLLKEAEHIYKEFQLKKPKQASSLYQNIGYNFLLKANYNKAIENYKKAMAQLPETEHLYRGTALHNLADIYARQNAFKASKQYYQKAIKTLELGSKDAIQELTQVYQNYGLMLYRKGEVEQGEKYLKDSYNLLDHTFGIFHPKTILSSNYLAYFYLSNQQYDKAISFFHKSIQGLQKEFTIEDVYQNPLTKDLIVNTELLYAIKYKARAFYAKFKQTGHKEDIMASVAAYHLAVVLVDKAKQTYLNEESLLDFTQSYKSSIIGNAILANYEAFLLTKDETYKDQIFHYSEKAKASLLSNALIDYNRKSKKGIPQDWLEEEAKLKNELSVLKNRIEQTASTDTIVKIEEQLFDKKEVLDSLSLKIQEELVGLNIELEDIEPVTVNEIQNKLCEDELLIEYTLTEYSLYIKTIGPGHYNIIKTKLDSTFYSKINQFRRWLSNTDFERQFKQIKAFNQLSYELYQILIQPIEKDIQNKRLIIVPEEELLYIPFDLLCTDGGQENQSFQNLNYLIKKHPISYNYSSTLRFKVEKGKSNSKHRFIAYAPEYNDISGLDVLPYAQEEVKVIKDRFPCSHIVQKMATEHHFKKQAKDYRYLHLSMHANISDKGDLFSNLFFNPAGDTIEDGNLEINELYRLKINSDLVVLSGCRTGDGTLYKGEGLYSLSRGFMRAACPNVTLTLWDVNDESSYKIVSHYYRFLSEGFTNDVAMQKAKLEYLKQASSLGAIPYFWGAYMVLGDNNLIIDTERNSFLIFILTGLVLLIALALFFKLRLRKHRISLAT